MVKIKNMAYYAVLDNNNIVVDVKSAGHENDWDGEIGWFQELGVVHKRTSYNTRGGIHYNPITNEPSEDQTKAFRKNYAGIGYYYDEVRDAFIPPKPYPSWILDEFSCLWDSPIPYPNTSNILEPYIWYNRYFWNEDIINWELMKPFVSWSLNQDNYYVSPIPYPNDGNQYYWDEENKQWNIYNT